jgi:hypothetical protein
MGVANSGGCVNRICRIAATVVGMAITWPAMATDGSLESTDQAAVASKWWLGGGIGVAQANYGSAAPGNTGLALTLEGGWRITPHWGLGLELGMNMTDPSCKICGTDAGNRKTQFNHLFLVAEYRPRESGWRLRAGAGESEIDVYYWDGWEYITNSVTTFGMGLSAGYQWRLGSDSPLSLGVRLSGETANFPARSNLGTAPVPYSATTLTVQLVFN